MQVYRCLDVEDAPELTENEVYFGASDDGQLVDIYDRLSGNYIGTFVVERFIKVALDQTL